MINIELTPGAGMQESLDFKNKLVKMYTNFLNKHKVKFKTFEPEYNKRITVIEVDNDIIFKVLYNETGIHRLVRVSPFDLESRRHTSFTSVHVFNVDNKLEFKDNPVRSYILDPYKAVSKMGELITDKVDDVLNGHLELIGVEFPKND
jgi:peptide chain release factor 2